MFLNELSEGDRGVIIKVLGRGAFRKRILEMGFIPGKMIRVVKKAPLKDPIEYNIMGYNVSLRGSESALIEVFTEEEARKEENREPGHPATFDEILMNKKALEKGKTIHVALVGNPNSGKTTLFNVASGSHERVGNYSGVTVDAKKARIRIDGYTINIIDLPGTYSLSAYSPEELFVRNYILRHHPDVVINVVDGSNLERNLYLTSQLIDMDIRVVIALNMYDELTASGSKFDHERMGKLIGMPFIPTVSSRGKGIELLLRKVIEVYEDRDETVRHIHINYGYTLENAIDRIQQKIKIPENYFLTDKISSRFLSVKLLEKDADASSRILPCPNHLQIISTVQEVIRSVEEDLKTDTESLITDAKYGFIEGALKETLVQSAEGKVKRSEVIDTFFTHRFFGIPVFLFLMWLAFWVTFKIGEYPQHWIEKAVGLATAGIESTVPAGPLKDLIIQGILGGVGGVIIFLPNILLLFLFISLMEDTGYMARGVFIMDKVMHRIGLHGKSFIPLLMGFGCNVPAIMSSRIIESRRDRLLTILINPFMSCSARLPVYILFLSAFFDAYQGTLLFLIYLTGILLAVASALLLNRTVFRKPGIPFVMELPPYRVPTLRSVLKHMWYRAQQYLSKIGGVILVASVIIWALGYFPMNTEREMEYRENVAQIEKETRHRLETAEPARREVILQEGEVRMHEARTDYLVLKQEESFIGRIGQFIQPVMEPLGFDWKMSISILTGIAAKEIIVGTMGVLYHTDLEDVSDTGILAGKLRSATWTDGPKKGQPVYNQVVALSFILFILIYFPCVAVIATIRREAGHWKWAAFTVVYTTLLAWLAAFTMYQVGSLILA